MTQNEKLREMTYETWQMTNDKWHMTHDTWHMAHGTWHMTHDTWHMTNDTRNKKQNVKLHIAHMTHDTWCMMHDAWCMMRDEWCMIMIIIMIMMMMPNIMKCQISLNADADAGSMTPSRNERRYTLRSKQSSPGRSFFPSTERAGTNLCWMVQYLGDFKISLTSLGREETHCALALSLSLALWLAFWLCGLKGFLGIGVFDI